MQAPFHEVGGSGHLAARVVSEILIALIGSALLRVTALP
jgi:hypothetical protein